MKSSSLYRLGGLALLIAAILYAIGNLVYFLSGQPQAPTALGLWLAFAGDSILVLGLGALFARQSERGGILGLAGYVLLVLATMFFIGNYAVNLGVAAGAFTTEQIAQVPFFTVAGSVMSWMWFAGLVAFGISIYRAGVLPKYAGALLVLLAVVQQLIGLAGFLAPVFAVLSVASWAWLGWYLLAEKRSVAPDPALVAPVA
ncbi:MAG: hypothetical protein KIS95_09350 [Anaerolineae bacterium]|uniref:hypothetical protein n=1 Tax=Promineifilum sp. TaxID=2664178 RepID=UPI001DE8D31A|nr:hypothetical protein [Anaerolineales bacterium]MCB8935798.1 hypothetical protein [Promineifilum sp.]MCO5180421.1 hypothetical protein [Promineifilum sp.]MCW5847423.1 hypothetical protein [Anaerolineae bacterium]